MTPTEEQLAAAKDFLHKWRLDDSHGHLEALAELLAEREALASPGVGKCADPHHRGFGIAILAAKNAIAEAEEVIARVKEQEP